MVDSAPPAFAGIHYVKLPIGNLARSLAFYEVKTGSETLRERWQGGT